MSHTRQKQALPNAHRGGGVSHHQHQQQQRQQSLIDSWQLMVSCIEYIFDHHQVTLQQRQHGGSHVGADWNRSDDSPSSHFFPLLFDTVQRLIEWNYGHVIHDCINHYFQLHLEKGRHNLIFSLSDASFDVENNIGSEQLGRDTRYCSGVAQLFDSFQQRVLVLSHVMAHLDTGRDVDSLSTQSLHSCAMNTFRSIMLLDDSCEGLRLNEHFERFIKHCLPIHLHESDQTSFGNERSLVKQVCQMFMDIGTFGTDIEPIILKSVKEQYTTHRKQLLQRSASDGNISIGYLHAVRELNNNLMNPNQRSEDDVTMIFPQSTLTKLLQVFIDVYLKQVLMMNTAHTIDVFCQMIHGVMESLSAESSHLFHLLYSGVIVSNDGRSDDFEFIEWFNNVVLKPGILQYGQSLMNSPKHLNNDPIINRVQLLIKYQDALCLLKQNYFQSHTAIVSSIDTSFKQLLNRIPRLPEYLSIYAHHSLLSSVTNQDSSSSRSNVDMFDKSDVMKHFESFMTLFHLLDNKEHFEKYYLDHQLIRLSVCISHSLLGSLVPLEKLFIAKMNESIASESCDIHPYQLTENSEKIMKDLDVSIKLTKQFKEHQSNGDDTLSVKVIGLSQRANVLASTVQFSPQLQCMMDQFVQFYASNHPHSKLYWQSMIGTGTLIARFSESSVYELSVTTSQMILLLSLYNGDMNEQKPTEKYSAVEMSRMTGLEQSEVDYSLKLLTKAPPVLIENENNEYRLNMNFSHPKRKVKLASIRLVALNHDRESSSNRGNRATDENLLMETTIIQIMKTRGTVTQHDLIADVGRKLSVHHLAKSSTQILKTIDRLIDLGYMTLMNSDDQPVTTSNVAYVYNK